MTALGRLEKADLHEAWAHEALDFTPWLAQPDNISLLAETLGYGPDGLEVEAVERIVRRETLRERRRARVADLVVPER